MSSTHRCYSFCSAAEDTVNRQAQSHPGQPKRCQDISDKARKYSVLARLREPSSGMPRESLASDLWWLYVEKLHRMMSQAKMRFEITSSILLSREMTTPAATATATDDVC
ncbi:hypothetical protein NW764_011317 [Fusarium oxysporum]|nr:hypothetical protein NW764_011317 [Fusarium oxysporum]